MAEEDLQQFLQKVKALNALVECLDHDPTRRRQFAACSDHNAVVSLAASWGFEIGRRWGERSVDARSASTDASQLLADVDCSPGEEHEDVLCSGAGWRLVKICSNAASSPPGFWYQQNENEWLTLLRGSALIRLDDPDQWVDLSVGDQLLLPAGRRHRVERTDPYPGTTWLALYWTGDDGRTHSPVGSNA